MHNTSDPRPNFNMAPPSPSADPYHQGNIRMTLENSDLWKSFSDIGTEMIITKHGRRMFPHCNISLSGLQPEAKYVIMAEMIPVDNFRYKWNKEKWEVAGKAEPQPPCRTYLHPDSPAPGKHWMTQPLSLPKLKLTNNTLDQHGYIILHSMQRYYPRFHVVQAETLYSVRWGHFHTFSFSETSFTAVTAYQNTKITKLKIDHNPFAKGFRKEGSHTRIKRHRPGKSPGKVAKKSKRDVDTEFQNPPELQRVPYDPQSTEGRLGAPDEVSAKEDLFSPWAVEQDPSQGLHTELHGQDCSSEEQMVPASMAYQPYRSVEYGRLLSPSSAAEDCGGRRSYESHGPDVATVPGGHEASRPGPAREMGHHHRPLALPAMPHQDYRLTPNTMPMTSKSSPGLLAYPPLYGHYTADQGVGQWGGEGGAGQYLGPSPALPHHPHLLAADHGAPQRSYAAPTNTHHQGNTAEWSQYPLFSYSCW